MGVSMICCPPRGTLTHFKEVLNGKGKSNPGNHR